MSGFPDLFRKTFKKEIGGQEFTFSNLTLNDHHAIWKKYPEYNGIIGSLLEISDVPTFEGLALATFLMLKPEHKEIEIEWVMSWDFMTLSDIIADAMTNFYVRDEGESKSENPTKNQTGGISKP